MNLIEQIKKLKPILKTNVSRRTREFEELGKRDSREWFKELCFCILTANFNAERSIKIQKKINDGFLEYDEKKLAKELKRLGHRFPNTRANYIMQARKYAEQLKDTINRFENEKKAREWLVKNIKGIGWKEASHFLRNVGYKNVAIIDFHIIDLLGRENLIKRPKTITKKRYLEIENVLKNITNKVNLNLAELDLYLWYMETGKILK